MEQNNRLDLGVYDIQGSFGVGNSLAIPHDLNDKELREAKEYIAKKSKIKIYKIIEYNNEISFFGNYNILAGKMKFSKKSGQYEYEINDRAYDELAKIREEARNHVTDVSNLKVYRILENAKGLIFLGLYNVKIAEYKRSDGTFSYDFSFNKNACREIEERRQEAEKQGQNVRVNPNFKDKCYNFVRTPIGKAICGTTIAIIIGGCLLLGGNKNESPVEATNPPAINTIQTAPDEVLISWANYAYGKYTDDIADSPYDGVKYRAEMIYQDNLIPMFSSYYNYLDIVSSDLPEEILGNAKDTYHSTFRTEALELSESLGPNYDIGKTPLGNAIAYDNPNDQETKVEVYVPLKDLENSPYSVDNLPEDAIVYNGQVYILDSHIYETLTTDNNKSIN